MAVLALAKNDEEAQAFRLIIKNTISNADYKNIMVIDALSTPLGLEEFEKYVDYSAMAMYYQGNNNQQSKDNARKAKEVLERTWKDRIQQLFIQSCRPGCSIVISTYLILRKV